MKASIVLTLFTAVCIGVSGCDFTAAEEAFNEFDVIIALDEVNSFVALSIVDGQTQDFVQQPVNVRFLGEGADQIIDMFSDPVNDIEVSGGLGTFGISNVLTPSASEPVSVRISVSTNGYQPNSATLSMNSTGRTDAQIVLVRENQGLAGSESGSSSGNADASGDVMEDFRAVTTPNFTNQAEAGVLLPAGTHGSTESGVSAEGQLRADIIYYTSNTSSSSLAFPGGFQTPVLTTSGSLEETTLTTAGFMTITVTDENGHEITQFNPPIELSMEIEPNTINPMTGNPVDNGDRISFFSYDEEQAVWIEEGDSELSGPGMDGNYYAAFLTSHLTTWSAGYMDNGCSSGVFSVERNGNEGSIFARASSASAGWFGRTIVIPQGDSEFTVADAPGFLTDFEVFFELGGQQRIIQQSNSICDAAGVATFDPPFNQVDVTFSMDLGPQCPALRVNDVPTFTIYYKLPLDSDASATPVGSQPDYVLDSLGRITGGSILVPGLELGQTYRFYTTINNEREERDIRISGDQVVFDISQDVLDADICASN